MTQDRARDDYRDNHEENHAANPAAEPAVPMNSIFPFAAIVGQDTLKRALLLCAVNPSLSGVLIRGDKGTAKSTAARGLRELLVPIERVPGCPYNCAPGAALSQCEACSRIDAAEPDTAVLSPVPFVNLPLGATEDRVLGSLDLERVLKDGKRAFQPGLLAAAHRGMLYIDEVNLLPDHLVDSLLDVAAMGQHTIEREGLSISHPAQITLIGTMNPEEGDLRPQLLDRFAMMVEVTAPDVPAVRSEVVRRRLAFDAHKEGFAARWAAETDALRTRVSEARERLPRVELPDSLLDFVSTLCCEFGATSLRADITLNKVALTHAALEGRLSVDVDDIAAAAELVLPHRRRRKPFEQPGLDRERLEEALDRMRDASQKNTEQAGKPNSGTAEQDDVKPSDPHAQDRANEPEDVDAEAAAKPGLDDGTEARQTENPQDLPDAQSNPRSASPGDDPSSPATTVFAAAAATEAPALRIASRDEGGAEGRRSIATAAARGAYTHAVATAQPKHLAVDATLRHAILREPGRLHVTRDDLHDKVLTGKQAHLILLIVDASGSMAARRRMEAVKGCVLGLLEDAYRRRDEIAVIAFRGEHAELVLPPTRNVELAQRALQDLPTGGRTPLAQALELGAEVLMQRSIGRAASDTTLKPLLVLLSDGRANVPLNNEGKGPPFNDGHANLPLNGGESYGDAWQDTLVLADQIAQANISALVLDTERGVIRHGRAKVVAEAMQAEYRRLDEWSADTLAITIRERLA
jgi:magnesium chelatase subunit D